MKTKLLMVVFVALMAVSFTSCIVAVPAGRGGYYHGHHHHGGGHYHGHHHGW